MKVITSSIFLLLCRTDGSHSFAPSLSLHPNGASRFKSKQSTSKLLYSYDDSFLTNGSPYLHRIANLRGGDAYQNNNHQQYGSLNSLSVTELKRILNDRCIDYRDCLEKRDLIERILSSPAKPAVEGGGWLSAEENRVVNTFTRASPSVAYIQTVVESSGRSGRGFELKGTEVPVGAGSGFLWDDRVSFCWNWIDLMFHFYLNEWNAIRTFIYSTFAYIYLTSIHPINIPIL